ncbi:hypothetical protein GCM10023148_58150 [Actinokineospora soli]
MRKWIPAIALAIAAAGLSAPGASATLCATPTGECLETSVVQGGICWDPERYCPVSVVLNQVWREDVRVYFRTVDGTALAGLDYVGVRDAVVTIPRGQTSVRVDIALLRVDRFGRYFSAEVFRPSAGVVVQSRTEVAIRS